MQPRVFIAAALCLAGAAALAGPAELPPPDYDGTFFVDSKGCAFDLVGSEWTTHSKNAPCGHVPTLFSGAPQVAHGPIGSSYRGTVSRLTGFPIPRGYKVAWEDGRLNPLRGDPAN